MTDLLTTQYNILTALGKYKTNPLVQEFKNRVEINVTRCPINGNEVTGVVFWNKDKRGDPRDLRVVKYIPLVPDVDEEEFNDFIVPVWM